MRDAFGGAFMIRLFLVFLIIYVFFIALALNYAKAFKVKNAVIEYLESHEIYQITDMSASAYEEMENYFETEIMGNMNYRVSTSCNNDRSDEIMEKQEYCNNGIKIVRYTPTSSNTNKLGSYYKVSTYFGWSIPFINSVLWLTGRDDETVAGVWTVSGETRLIYKEG